MKKLARLRQELSQLEALAFDMTALTQAEESLAQREMELRAIVDTMHTGLMRLDQDIVVNWVNQPMAALFGFRPEEMVGRSWYELVPVMEQHRRIHERVLRGETLDFPCTKVVLAAGERFLEVHYRPVLGGDGTVSDIFVIAADITGRKRAEEALREAEAECRRLAAGRGQQVPALKRWISGLLQRDDERRASDLTERAGEKPPYDLSFVSEEKR